MRFSEFQYERPDFEKLKQKFNKLLEAFKAAENINKQSGIMEEINNLRTEFDSMATIANIRYTIDTTNEEYDREKAYFNEVNPEFDGLVTEYYKAIINSKYKEKLKELWGEQIFKIAELSTKTFSKEVLEDLKEENKLVTEYVKLLSSAKIIFDGEEKNLAQIDPYLLNPDRSIRKKAAEAKFSFFEENETKLDEIYDNLVKVRTKIAKKLGYNNFVGLGYDRLLRSDYNPIMAANFRKQVLQYIVPAVNRLKKRQAERLGLESLKYYDDGIKFTSGNAKPKGSPEWIIENGKAMYSELSEETKKFFNFMVENEFMDLVSKKGKAGGGYCTYIGKYKAPFIFSNFNGTEADIKVLTHEAGHAFQVFLSRDYKLPEYMFPTLEACEIHSMSMEYLTWSWMDLFFKEDGDKFKFTHLSERLAFIPYGVSVDEFQHFVYENPEATPDERKKAWREIEKKYCPYKDYEDNDYLERGNYWVRQTHIFKTPFYYIDYTLAQVCAMQFWKKANENREEAWKDYLRLCKEGGSKPFLQLVKTANLISPFEDGCIESIISDVEAWINNVDDSKF